MLPCLCARCTQVMVVGLIAGARSLRWLTLALYLANSLAKCAGQILVPVVFCGPYGFVSGRLLLYSSGVQAMLAVLTLSNHVANSHWWLLRHVVSQSLTPRSQYQDVEMISFVHRTVA